MMEDPKTRFPDRHFSKDRLKKWKSLGLCLCGCGITTALCHGDGPDHNYFCRGHARRK